MQHALQEEEQHTRAGVVGWQAAAAQYAAALSGWLTCCLGVRCDNKSDNNSDNDTTSSTDLQSLYQMLKVCASPAPGSLEGVACTVSTFAHMVTVVSSPCHQQLACWLQQGHHDAVNGV